MAEVETFQGWQALGDVWWHVAEWLVYPSGESASLMAVARDLRQAVERVAFDHCSSLLPVPALASPVSGRWHRSLRRLVSLEALRHEPCEAASFDGDDADAQAEDGGKSKRPSMRFGHSATLVSKGLLVVFGGRAGSELYNDVQVLDVDRMQWLAQNDHGGSRPAPRAPWPPASAGPAISAPGSPHRTDPACYSGR